MQKITYIKLGIFVEKTVEYMLAFDALEEPVDAKLVSRIRVLKREGLLPYEIDQILYKLRTKRNVAVHDVHNII